MIRLKQPDLKYVRPLIFYPLIIITVVVNMTVSLYIHQTIARDREQEHCMAETIQVLRDWAVVRNDRDAATDLRDNAARTMLDAMANDPIAPPPEDKVKGWRDAIDHERQVRRDTQFEADRKLPRC